MYDSPCLAANANAQWSQPQVIVDDSDPRIVYTGNWVSDLGEGSSYWGNSFNDTTHRSKLDSNSSSFSFSFQGTAFTVLGGVDVQQSPGGTGDTAQESRTCLVDGQQLGNITSGTNILCGVEGLNEAEHKVTFTAHAASPSGLVVYVDAIQYTPLSGQDSSGDRAIMMVDACDQSINFGGGAKHWVAFDPPQSSGVGSGAPLGYRSRYKGVNTNFSGNELSYEFTGTKLQWMSTVLSPQDGGSPSQTQTQAAWANFEVHTSDSRVLNDTIQLQQLAQANLTQYNKLVYETPDLPAGTHKLIATYQGDSDTVPLSLSYFYVHTTTTTTTTPSSHDSGRRIGAIVGGVVGGVVGLLAVLGLLWVVYHKRQRKMEMRAWDVVWKNRTQRGQVWQESLEMGPPKSERG